MIYYFFGDIRKSIEEANVFLNSLVKKHKYGMVKRFDEENFSRQELESFIDSQELFGGISIIVGKRLSNFKEGETALMECVKKLSESKNIFLIVEENSKNKIHKELRKYSKNTVESKKGVEKYVKQNIFTVTDAFLKKDKKALWTEIQRLMMKGVSAEEIHGILFWQAKILALSKKTENESINELKEIGISEYPLMKTRRYLNNFEREEIVKIISELCNISHRARFGRSDLELELEQFSLAI